MQLRDLSDAFWWIRRLIFRVDRLESGAMLENSSISNGRMRFIGGLLRVDSGGRVEIVGTLQVDGTSTVTGEFTVAGPWSLTGDGTITGRVEISGPVEISGDVDLTGTMTVTGDVEVTGSGKITVGNIIIEDGKIKAGGMTINPDVNGGQIEFGDGRTINAGTGFLGVYDGDRQIIFNLSGVTLVAGGRSLAVGPAGIRVTGAGTIAQADVPDSFLGAAVIDSSGLLLRVIAGA
ncbi:polymer-forming cytoskeletal protein [Microbacterium sp. CFBP 8794]|uniref:polymer-forming cytoskeletal protein n=1 Tax=Microbacterium sp. CFBP 8794 TaxID=2775269 RepID=UPI00177F809D|nr:polymer-forming cytoskeletal protein [Microbacterium sp. CFBP 8794]MBD8477561.1 polymer-forming cytoskeletal protein [Microbacterium sp. CFBP 8794]